MKGRSSTTTAPATGAATFENAADQAVLKKMEAGIAAGEDVFGDYDDDAAAPIHESAPEHKPDAGQAADAGDDTEPNAEQGSEDGEIEAEESGTLPANGAEEPSEAAGPATADEPPTKAAAAEEPVLPAPTVLAFKTQTAPEMESAKRELLKKKAEAFEKYTDGTMDAAAFSEIDAEVMGGLMTLASQQALLEASAQTAMAAAQSALDGIKTHAAAEGLIDYTKDKVAIDAFDAAAEMLNKDPANASLNDREFYLKAHKLVLAMRGLAPTPGGAPTPTPVAPRTDKINPVQTLRGVPTAATPNTNGGLNEELTRLNGQDFEDRVAAIPKAQRDAWMDS